MEIPKIIHYCWISGEENMPDDIKSCLKSWHKYLPDYKFINWNDSNFDWDICKYTRYCRDKNLYAFCSDFVRYWALYNYGGIYLDTDVMLYKSFDELLSMDRIISKERFEFTSDGKNERIECAILGCNKGDDLFKGVIDYYMNTNMRPFDNYTCIAPEVLSIMINSNGYEFNNIDFVEDEIKENKIINLLNSKKYFDNEFSDNTIAKHMFKSDWVQNFKNSSNNHLNDIMVYVYTHNSIPENINKDNYTILTCKDVNLITNQQDNILSDYVNDYMSENQKLYCECSGHYYVWKKNPHNCKYIGFQTYRRKLDIDLNTASFILNDNYDMIAQKETRKETVYEDYSKNHNIEDLLLCCDIAMDKFGIPKNDIDSYLNSYVKYHFLLFYCNKELFEQFCEFSFGITDEFMKIRKCSNINDVKEYILNNKDKYLNKEDTVYKDINDQIRILVFLHEFLLQLFIQYKKLTVYEIKFIDY